VLQKIQRMEELIKCLNHARYTYEQEATSLMSDFEYDKLYDELLQLEDELQIIRSNSPTRQVGYEVVSELPKEKHESRMLSLDKTKDVETLVSFLGEHKGDLSWKLDGLTVVLTYRDGVLYKAITRGNGDIGEVVTNNAKTFFNLPIRIPYVGELIIRGEAVISYSDFERINAEIEEVDAKYKNPRNLCSGSVRQLDSSITKQRHVGFYAFAVIRSDVKEPGHLSDFDKSDSNDTISNNNSRYEQLRWLASMGFETVHNILVDQHSLRDTVLWFKEQIEHFDLPSDGLVLSFDDISYGLSLGTTAKFPRDAMAFKWQDEIKETTLLEMEWSPSRTGLINPVAIFEAVDLEGTTVTRASVHNLSIVKELELGIGDTITVYKANMIIPQIADNLTRSNSLVFPEHCPLCGGIIQIANATGTETLMCINQECPAKQIKAFALFVSRDALNIEGLSEETLKKFISLGYIRDFTDLFTLHNHQQEIEQLDGFGVKSYHKLDIAIQKSRVTSIERILYGLGIPGIGTSNAKVIARALQYNPDRICQVSYEELLSVEGIGPILAKAYVEYFSTASHLNIFQSLVRDILELQQEENEELQDLAHKTFVITGSLAHYRNREELKANIEARGGKVTGSVTSKTDYLINNDVLSASSKNKKARELGIPILSEQDFLAL